MSGFADVLNELFPTDWLDPYGSMPLNKQYSVQIDITQVETDDGIKVTAVKTPPQSSTTSVCDAINMALGMGCCSSACENEKKSGNSGSDSTEREEKPQQSSENTERENRDNIDSSKQDEKPDWNKKKDD